MKAYITSSGKVLLKAGRGIQYYDKSVFADKIFLEGIECPPSQVECDITGIRNDGGTMQGSIEADQVFVNEWKKKYPMYFSPYAQPP